MNPSRDMIAYMPAVKNYHARLDSLAEQWNLLTLLGQMSNIGISMSETRAGFQELNDKLLDRLCTETLKKLVREMEAKAQVAVDIVIRNLFERTADIGFLATDDDIREFIKFLNGRDTGENRSAETDNLWLENRKKYEQKIVDRFNEYVKKYSVYSNIILLDPNGKLLTQLDSDNPIRKSKDSIIQEAKSTQKEFVESYKYTDLNPRDKKSLTYAFRVTESSEPTSPLLGVLVLVFRFEDEMEGVFANLLDGKSWMELLLLDKEGVTISTSDPHHIPVGVKLEKVTDEEYKIVKFGGREYIAKTCLTKGYQGFFGLGWCGHAMLPLELAFKERSDDKPLNIDGKILESVLANSSIFPDDLKTIPLEADKIQKELDITVWNGNVQIANTKTGDNSFSKSLLNEVSKTGAKTKEIFEESINNLNQTVISSYLEESSFEAFLAIDIMDRNLYERANDCRWWALTSYFRKVLDAKQVGQEERKKCGDILSYINNLYTVYTNLFIYDASGTVIAVSNEKESSLIGVRLKEEWVSKTLALKNSQDYVVSEFEKSHLYGGKHTYIYNAAIKSLDSARNIGGIGIVFDSEPQFSAMLFDALPKGGDGGDGKNFALFLSRDKNVIASTIDSIRTGDKLDLDSSFFNKANKERYSKIVEFNGRYYVVGSAVSGGYREYKSGDGYKNDVVALIFIEIGEAKEVEAVQKPMLYEAVYPRVQGNEESVEISTFYIQDKLFGLESSSIICSLANQDITHILGVDDNFLGVITHRGKTVSIIDISSLLGKKIDYYTGENYILLVKNRKGATFGIVVSSVKDSPEIPKRCIDVIDTRLSASGLTKAVVKPESGNEKREMLSILSLESIYERFHKADIEDSFAELDRPNLIGRG